MDLAARCLASAGGWWSAEDSDDDGSSEAEEMAQVGHRKKANQYTLKLTAAFWDWNFV
jgi:hypothetical protein